MKLIKKFVFPALLILVASSSCKNNLLDNPNLLNTKQADVNFLLNKVQLSFNDFFVDASFKGMEVTRMINFFGENYTNGFTPSSFDNMWTLAYSDLLANINTLQSLAEKNNLNYQLGIAKVLKSYVLITMVDYFGNIPYSEALNPDNLNPKLDSGKEIYQSAMVLLDSAIENLKGTSPLEPQDVYYHSQADWIRLANTIKLKIWIQTRLVDPSAKEEIETLVADGNLINNADEDFVFQYGSNLSAPDSRDPSFANNYTNGASDYMSNYYMNLLYRDKVIKDPRIRYYFFRQTLQQASSNVELPCLSGTKPLQYTSSMPFCSISDDGYWGRDHLDNAGVPPDTKLRTIWGVYPAGGKFDADSDPREVDQNSGGKGVGIQPIMLSSYVKFMLAEAGLTLNISGLDPRQLLQQGIEESIGKVMAFANIDPAYGSDITFIPTQQYIDSYVKAVLDRYDSAPDNDKKLNIIVKEYFIALWGNGIEAFNTYRRTGKPDDLQYALDPNPGEFYRSFIYPGVYITRNSSAIQKTGNTQQVFWDNNPAGFIR
jgi:hypothetical protein